MAQEDQANWESAGAVSYQGRICPHLPEWQPLSWNHIDHFPGFALRSRDHHDLLHNGILAMVTPLENIKTTLVSGLRVHGCKANTLVPWPRPSSVPPSFIPVKAYISIWESAEQRTSMSALVYQMSRRLPVTPMHTWKSNNG